MKLGKALATGVAQERPQVRQEEIEFPGAVRPAEMRDVDASASTAAAPSTSTSAGDEVPVAR
ncbi:hypothetical protein ACFV0T_39615 [Streptomyces sp. NPDC059582]|uniref:hypothetical protein n=1 Tax=Streptomyces sp. NPDC059582 TaxID=3346875 RepID=UPI0036ABDB68